MVCLKNNSNFLALYVNTASSFNKKIIKFLYQYFSLDYVLTHFFMPYKKVDNIAGWFVGIVFKVLYLMFVIPLFLLAIILMYVFWFGLPLIILIMLVI